MTAITSRRAILAGAAAIIPAAIAAPALASIEQVDPAAAAFERLQGNWTIDNLRAAFRLADPQVKKLIYMLSREEELIEDLKADAKLFMLSEKLQKAWMKYRTYRDGPAKKAEARYNKLAPPRPEFPELPPKLAKQLPDIDRGPTPVRSGPHLTASEYEVLAKLEPKHPIVAWYDRAIEEHTQKWRARKKEAVRIAKETGFDVTEEETERLYEACWPIYKKILATRAKTISGIRVKLDAAKLMDVDDKDTVAGENLGSEWASVRADIRAIGSGKSAV